MINLTTVERTELTYYWLQGFRYIVRHEIGTVELFKDKPELSQPENAAYRIWYTEIPIKDHSRQVKPKLGEYKFVSYPGEPISIYNVIGPLEDITGIKRVIVAGSREFNNYPLLEKKLEEIIDKYGAIEIVSGTARGADSLGEEFAKNHGVPVKRFRALWDIHGRAAGYIRNAQMAQYADICIVFWDGESRGSKHMIDLATKYNLPLQVIRY